MKQALRLATVPLLLMAAPTIAAERPLSLGDVLGLSAIDQVSRSSDGAHTAVTVIRPAQPGEIYGRTNYELDTSRADVWVISDAGPRNITQGQPTASGFWCATWSPNGNRLAMLSTKAEGREPRGGNNVRVYIWERTTGGMHRLSDDGVVTQTRLGAGMYRMSVTAAGSSVPRPPLSSRWEASPFGAPQVSTKPALRPLARWADGWFCSFGTMSAKSSSG